jgi:integrase
VIPADFGPPPLRHTNWETLIGWNATDNFRRSLATFLVIRGTDVKTIQGLLRHAKVTTTLDLYSQSIDAAKLEAQEDIALAITSAAAAD